jgi:hypothetical protein
LAALENPASKGAGQDNPAGLPISIKLRMAGVSRRGEGGGEWMGGPLWHRFQKIGEGVVKKRNKEDTSEKLYVKVKGRSSHA